MLLFILYEISIPEVPSNHCIPPVLFPIISLSYLVDASTSELGLVGVQPETEDPSLVKAAVFYSITSTQKGLQVCLGSFGFLISKFQYSCKLFFF